MYVVILFALRNVIRPYKDYPVFKPYIRDGKFALENESDKRMFAQIGFYWCALICADLKSKVHDIGLDRYSIGSISYGTLSCKVISGRLIRHNAVINPTRHKIYFLRNDSPLVKLAVKESHARLSCNLGVLQYVKNAQLIGITHLQ